MTINRILTNINLNNHKLINTLTHYSLQTIPKIIHYKTYIITNNIKNIIHNNNNNNNTRNKIIETLLINNHKNIRYKYLVIIFGYVY